MSNLLQKSRNSETAAGILVGNGLYAISIHCTYYRCFQHMLHIQERHFRSGERSDWTQGSHNALINLVGQELKARNNNDYIEYNRGITKLKGLRVQADYKERMFDMEVSREAIRLADVIVQLFRKHFQG